MHISSKETKGETVQGTIREIGIETGIHQLDFTKAPPNAVAVPVMWLTVSLYEPVRHMALMQPLRGEKVWSSKVERRRSTMSPKSTNQPTNQTIHSSGNKSQCMLCGWGAKKCKHGHGLDFRPPQSATARTLWISVGHLVFPPWQKSPNPTRPRMAMHTEHARP